MCGGVWRCDCIVCMYVCMYVCMVMCVCVCFVCSVEMHGIPVNPFFFCAHMLISLLTVCVCACVRVCVCVCMRVCVYIDIVCAKEIIKRK